ncbi:MPPV-152 ankyrin repeat protein [Magpiepox virus 2]|nr:ankyrin repeat protein [Magpiepox virus]QZW33447.1 MPPV-152 ankyrin repeat protein [Magpiepox virus 2]
MENKLYKLMFIGSDNEIFSAIKDYISENKEYDEYPLYHNLPLQYAISARRLEIVKYLLKLDYDPNVMTNLGYYPIQLISMQFNLTMLPIDTKTYNLVNKYINEIRDCTSFTTSVSIPIVREILKGNTNISKSYMIELSEKVRSEELLIADLLIIYGANINSIGGGSTALHYASESGNLYIVRLLVACGADITIKTFLGDSIFLYATKSNNVEVVKEIHSRSYVNDFTDDFKKIIKLVHNYTADMLKFLKDIGFDINMVDDLNRTVLHYTCFYNTTDDEKIKRILNYGVSIDAVDNDGFTALHYTIIYSNIKAIKILLDYGADVNINTKNDNDVLDLAVKTKNTEIILEVIKHYSDYINNSTALGNVTCSNDIKMISLLLNIGFDVNGKYYNSSSLLHLAVIFGKPETVKLLLEYGANPNITDKYGTTPLESALMVWHISNKYRREFSRLMTIDLVFRLYASPHDNDYSFDKNMSIIQSNSFLRKIKDLCLEEIENMKFIKINSTYSLHSLLINKNIITVLDDNPSFKQIIRNNLCNFHVYRDRIEEFITNTSKFYI